MATGYFFYNQNNRLVTPHGVFSVPNFTLSNIDIPDTSYDSVSFDVSSQITGQQTIRFNGDGTKMYTNSFSGRTIYEYDLGTPWVVSSAVYNSVSLDTSSESTSSLSGFSFSDNGSKLFVCKQVTNQGTTYRYDLSTPYDLSTASFATGQTFSIGNTEIQDVHVSADGLKIIALRGGASGYLRDYTLSSAFDLTTASAGTTLSIDDEYSEDARDMHVSSDGTELFLAADTEEVIFHFKLSTGWDLSTIGLLGLYDGSALWTNIRGVFVGNNDTKLYVSDGGASIVYQYSTSGPFQAPNWELDITQSSYDAKSYDFSAQVAAGSGHFFKNDGLKLYISSFTSNAVYQYTLSTAWDVSTASYDSVSLDTSVQVASTTGLFIGNSGTELYVVDNGDDDVHQYTLSTPWDLSTGSYTQSYAAQGANNRCVYFSENGQRMFTQDASNNILYSYFLSTPWDISTATYMGINNNIDMTSEDNATHQIFFNEKGSQFFVTADTGNTILQYDMDGLFAPVLGSNTSSFDISSQGTNPRSIFIRQDVGTKMYILDVTNSTIYQYSVSA